MKNLGLFVLVSGLFTGCAALDGLDAKGNFDCKAPDGVLCESMSGVVANMQANNLPSQQVKKQVEKTPVKGSEFKGVISSRSDRVLTTMEYTGAPLLRNPKSIRVWVAPWEGADRTLFDQQFFYLVIDNWKWNIEHNSKRIQQAYAPSGSAPYVATSNVVKPNVGANNFNDDPIPVGGTLTGNGLPKEDVEGMNLPKNNQQLNNQINKELQKMNLDVSQFGLPRFTN